MIMKYQFQHGKFIESDDYESIVWIRLADPSPEEIASIATEMDIDIDDMAETMLRDKGARFKIGNRYAMTLLDAPYENTGGQSLYNTRSVSIIRTEKKILTVSQARTDIFDAFAEKPPKTLVAEDTINLELHIILSIMDRYNEYINHINQMRRDIEKAIQDHAERNDIYDLHQMESSLIYFITSLKSFAPIPDKMSKHYPDTSNADLFDDIRIKVSQEAENAEIYREIIDGTRDLINTMMSDRLNGVMKLLTVITLIMSIPVLITGMYGMNVVLPLGEHPWSFVVVCAMMVLTMITGLVLLRKAKLV